jgi:hypothetical protein
MYSTDVLYCNPILDDFGLIVSLKIKGTSKSLEEWQFRVSHGCPMFARPSVTIVKRNFENIGKLVTRHKNYLGLKKAGGHGKKEGYW